MGTCALRTFSLLGYARTRTDPTHSSDITNTACAFLISLFVIDLACWGVGRIVAFEILSIGEDIGWNQLTLACILTTIEVIVEVSASYWTPSIHRAIEKAPLTAKSLAKFALKAYLVSSLVAVLVYPPLGTAIHILDQDTVAVLVILIVVHALQYPSINQVGDQAIEMALPHWLSTFHGTFIHFPGCSTCCAKPVPTTAESLSVFLTLVRFVTAAIFALLYFACRGVLFIRWGGLLLLACFNLGVTMSMHRDHVTLTDGMQDQSIELLEVRGYSHLSKQDRSLVWFAVLAFSAPEQAFRGLTAIAILKANSAVAGGVVVLGGVLVLLYLLRRLRAQTSTGKEAQQLMRFSGWAGLLNAMTGLLAVSAGVLYFGGGSTLAVYGAMALLIPYSAVSQNLHAHFTQLLFLYPEEVSTDVQFWHNILKVAVNAPLLAANWVVISYSGSESEQMGSIAGIAVAMLLSASVYFTFIDKRLDPSISLTGAVERLASASADVAKQPTSELTCVALQNGMSTLPVGQDQGDDTLQATRIERQKDEPGIPELEEVRDDVKQF